jgi:hypothetical protein
MGLYSRLVSELAEDPSGLTEIARLTPIRMRYYVYYVN